MLEEPLQRGRSMLLSANSSVHLAAVVAFVYITARVSLQRRVRIARFPANAAANETLGAC